MMHERIRHERLADRLQTYYPQLKLTVMANDPAGHSLVVNATPLGMSSGDPLPFDVERLEPGAFVGEVVMEARVYGRCCRRDGEGLSGTAWNRYAV
ncbi:Uncharacterised protein [Kluyvera cryocrescens]|uniref:Uncharacterized protein n=1 Tax=Kluyvera cryocrescens TaxID=580 RepID=A0A485BT37_KLUCR|nr:Uncharacterised protein [Kluyvera cryocrescens]